MFAALVLVAAIDADAVFRSGDFAEAARAYAAAIQADPRDLDAALGLTRIAIYDNRLADAQHWLGVAQSIAPNDSHVAASAHTIDGRTDPAIDRVEQHNGPAVVPFLQTDPLPVVAVRVNGHDATFLIDTGAPNIVLDSAFAASVGIMSSAAGEGTFAGGEHAVMMKGTAQSLELGGWHIDNVPAAIMPIPALLGGKPRIDGILGTALFAHFLTTLDYQRGRLILRDAGESAQFEREAAARGATIVPMWLVGDHFIFVKGRAGNGPVGLFSVDTGGTFGVQLTKAAIDAGGITVDTAHPVTGVGGGGTVSSLPFTTSVAVGNFHLDNIPGMYFPNVDQYGIFPFTVTGTVSHSFFRQTALTFDFVAMRMVIQN